MGEGERVAGQEVQAHAEDISSTGHPDSSAADYEAPVRPAPVVEWRPIDIRVSVGLTIPGSTHYASMTFEPDRRHSIADNVERAVVLLKKQPGGNVRAT